MAYGQVDYTQLNRISAAVNQQAEREKQSAVFGMQVLRERADKENANNVRAWVAEQLQPEVVTEPGTSTTTPATKASPTPLSPSGTSAKTPLSSGGPISRYATALSTQPLSTDQPMKTTKGTSTTRLRQRSPMEMLNVMSQAGAMLSQTGGPHAQQAGKDLGAYLTARIQMEPKQDQSVTLEDDLRAGRITKDQFMELKHGIKGDKEIDTFTGSDNKRYTKFQKADGSTYYDPQLPAGVGVRENETGIKTAAQKSLETSTLKVIEARNKVKGAVDMFGGEDKLNQFAQEATKQVDFEKLATDSQYLQDLIKQGMIPQTSANQYKAAAEYRSAKTQLNTHETALKGKGYYVSEDGELIKGKAPQQPAAPPKMSGRMIDIEMTQDVPGSSGKTIKKGTFGSVDEAEFNPKAMKKRVKK